MSGNACRQRFGSMRRPRSTSRRRGYKRMTVHWRRARHARRGSNPWIEMRGVIRGHGLEQKRRPRWPQRMKKRRCPISKQRMIASSLRCSISFEYDHHKPRLTLRIDARQKRNSSRDLRPPAPVRTMPGCRHGRREKRSGSYCTADSGITSVSLRDRWPAAARNHPAMQWPVEGRERQTRGRLPARTIFLELLGRIRCRFLPLPCGRGHTSFGYRQQALKFSKLRIEFFLVN